MLHARIIVAVDRDWPLLEADVVDSMQDAVCRFQSVLLALTHGSLHSQADVARGCGRVFGERRRKWGVGRSHRWTRF